MLIGVVICGVVLLVVALFIWWQGAPLTPGSLQRRAPLQTMMHLRKSTALVVGLVLVVACVGTVALVRAYWPGGKGKGKSEAVVSKPLIPPTTPPQAGSFLERMPKEYPQVEKAIAAVEKPLPPRGVPVTPPVQNGVVHAATPPGPRGVSQEELARMLREQQIENQLAIEKAVTAALAAQARQQAVTPPAQPVTTGAQEPQKPTVPQDTRTKDWGYLAKPATSTTGEKGKPLTEAQQREVLAQAHNAGVIDPAKWLIPAKPLRTIYRSMELKGQLLDNINSDIPAKNIKIQIVETLYDKFNYGRVIVPKNSVAIVSQTGTPSFGQARLPLKVEQIEFPSGEILVVESEVADKNGAAGVPGKVDAHLGQLLLATGINAVLNLGLGYATGTPGRGQYYEDPAQQAARDAGQSVARDAKSYTDQVLKRPPTITVTVKDKHGKMLEPVYVTIQLLKNIQFKEEPTIVR